MLRCNNPLVRRDDCSTRAFPHIWTYYASADGPNPGRSEYHVPEIVLFKLALRMPPESQFESFYQLHQDRVRRANLTAV
jgi:hypothetical protein